MIGQTIPQQKIPVPHEPTPRDDAKKVVSEVLKRVDQLIRSGNLDHAQLEVKKAKAVDPRNVYALALEERISTLKADFARLEEIRHNGKPIPSPVITYISKTETEVPQIPTSPEPGPTITISLPAPPITPLPLSIANAAKPQEKREDQLLDRSADLESYRQALAHARVRRCIDRKRRTTVE